MKKTLIGALLALTAVAHAATKVPVQMIDTVGSTVGQAIVSGGPSGVSTWGSVSVSGLSPVTANTVLANATGSTATPTAFPMPSCSGANNALRWTAGTGFTCASSIALTSAGLNQFAATTSAQLASVVSDETGSGALVFGTSPTITSPTITGGSINNTPIGATTASTGRFTTITATGAITPSSTAGIVGTALGDNANAGSVGEFINPAATTGTSITNNVAVNCATAPLSAGDWDVEGVVQFAPAASTVFVNPGVGISTVSAAFGAFDTSMLKIGSNGQGLGDTLVTPTVRVPLSSAATVYLVASAGVSGGTATCNGRIRARRIR
ncbi:hypothetical protein K6W16_10305 [Burkholderia dolosa]|uniref:Lipoprotein n=1 Tax=Burkholderia dolosa TaxID=152500 RepID=A0A892IA12_9BURK|nr:MULTISPECIES: hypothetical protein [Burkholderia]AKE03050.1 hypothetical protein XM57_08925 [Burkholderia cepacia]AJY12573.1 putative gp19 [Burkholderia dolosa AU0158]AYZ97806.1 hypothetical protein EGY28_22885 [Burkholderia dolosa]ETP66805.1 hypothetical protein BDSB_05585 [Burkholderia dolosa PC543]MBR8419790.1 hypothetical protein [Burkholderia dolosa]